MADDTERIEQQIAAHEKMIAKDREENFTDVDDHRIDRNTKNGKPQTDADKALNVFLRKSFRDMSVDEALLVRNTMSTTTGSEGGHTVQTAVAATLMVPRLALSAIRARAEMLTP